MRSESEQIKNILAEIELEYQTWLDLIYGLTEEQITSQLEDDWSVVETLIYITAWQANALHITQQQADSDALRLNPHGSPAGILRINVDKFNQEIFDFHRDWSLDQALSWYKETNASLRSALMILPSDRLFVKLDQQAACMWFWRPAVIHSREHRHALERRLENLKPKNN